MKIVRPGVRPNEYIHEKKNFKNAQDTYVLFSTYHVLFYTGKQLLIPN